MTLLNIPSLCVSGEDVALHLAATEKNQRYRQFLDERLAKDIYATRAAQTFNMPVKDKEVSAVPPTTKEMVCMWEIFACVFIYFISSMNFGASMFL